MRALRIIGALLMVGALLALMFAALAWSGR